MRRRESASAIDYCMAHLIASEQFQATAEAQQRNKQQYLKNFDATAPTRVMFGTSSGVALASNFSRLSVSVEPDTNPSNSSNDALQAPPARRLDTTGISAVPQGGTIPFLPQRAQPASPEDHLAIILAMGKPSREDSKLEPAATPKARTASSVAKSFVLQKQAQQRRTDKVEGRMVEILREQMREELSRRLTKSNLAGNGAAKQSREMQSAFAGRLEELLFKTAKSVEAYSDSKTLDRRLKALMAAMQKRKARKAEPSATQQTKERPPSRSSTSKATGRAMQEQRKRKVLFRLLGQAGMARVFKVIAEIKLIHLGREVTQGNPYAPIKMCTAQGCSFLVPCQGDQKVPQVVRDLFFNTAIVAAYQKTPAERLPSLPWDQLLVQGEARLAAYHKWLRQRQASMKAPNGIRTAERGNMDQESII